MESLARAGGTVVALDVAEGLHFDTGGPGKVECVTCDLSDPTSIQEFEAHVRRQ